MKNVILCLVFLSLISCNNDDVNTLSISNNLKQRLVLVESSVNAYPPYTRDSIIQYYENKFIVRQDFYQKPDADSPYIGYYLAYHYNEDNYLVSINFYNDNSLNDHFATRNYTFINGAIHQVHYNKFNASNFSNILIDRTTHYEYRMDTISRYDINHLDNESVSNEYTYIAYGDLDSLSINNQIMYYYDDNNDFSESKCIRDDCTDYSNIKYEYGDTREPMVENLFGSELNSIIINSPVSKYHVETVKKYMTYNYTYFPFIERNGENFRYNYVFDDDDRLEEIQASGTLRRDYIIKYYYE